FPVQRARFARVVPATVRVLEAVGWLRPASWMRRRGRLVPRAVSVRPPLAPLEAFRMLSHGGRDQIATGLWRYGWWGFEWPLPDLFSLLLVHDPRTNIDIIDVGANTGFYSLLAVHLRSDVTAHAFEPLPEVRGLLSMNICLNR